jgi:hypothetical protein
MSKAMIRRRILSPTIFALILLIACDTGDEYTEDGRLVEKTDVRVTGVDVGRLVDSATQSTDGADRLLPTDTVYASVHTKGASSSTILGVRWKNVMGDEVNSNNLMIRPTGDTSTLFEFHHMAPMDTGQYTLEMRVNGKVVKTHKFVVTTGAEPRSLAPKTVTTGLQPRFAGVTSFFTNTIAKVSAAVESLRDRGDTKEQSPFEWRGLRGGMSFAKLDRISNPGTPWTCTPFLMSAVGLRRGIALESRNLSAGQINAMVDTVGKRVVDINYSVSWMKRTDPQKVELDREMTELARKWDGMPGLIRRAATPTHGPYSSVWVTPDSSWRATIFYTGDLKGAGTPDGFEIEEIHWGDRLSDRVTDSLKGQIRNPASDFYRTPNRACDALVQPR